MSSNSRFAVCVHILAYLAWRRDARVSSGEIAGSVATNPVVIRRMLADLVRARLVTAIKGPAGGFALARPPEKISLLDVQRAIEPEPDSGLGRFAPNLKCPIGSHIAGVIEKTLAEARERMDDRLAEVKLSQIHGELKPFCPSHP